MFVLAYPNDKKRFFNIVINAMILSEMQRNSFLFRKVR